jgi:hypothetical protein
MLRQLNQASARGRILGTPQSGVLGSLIPSSGASGPAYAYPSLSLPADANTEIRGRITTWPSAGVLAANEDTSFTFTGPDGTYTFQFQLSANGVDVGTPRTATMTIGGLTVAAGVGNAAAAGSAAGVYQGMTISAGVGAASASGTTASVQQGLTIAATAGSASAVGVMATISTITGVIAARVGNATAVGVTATISGSLSGFIPSPLRTVVFGGGTNTVNFDGGTNKVAFDGNPNTVSF